jgi:hypothetical protein
MHIASTPRGIEIWKFAFAVVLTAYGASSSAMCSIPTSVLFVEVVVNACEVRAGLGHSSGALVTAQVRAETTMPIHAGEWRRYGLDPEEWHIARHDAAPTREYFYFSQDPEICEQLVANAPLVLEQSNPCCDTFPVTHPACMDGRKVLGPLPEQMGSLGEPGGA